LKFEHFSLKILNDFSLNEMRSRSATLFIFCRNLKKVVSDGTAGGVLGEECRAVLRFVFGAGKVMWLNSTI
jgi:hypothetical protein